MSPTFGETTIILEFRDITCFSMRECHYVPNLKLPFAFYVSHFPKGHNGTFLGTLQGHPRRMQSRGRRRLDHAS